MKTVIIDGQGGQLGAQIIKAVLQNFPDCDITAIGTNAIATSSMLKAGANKGATGENPVVVACRTADVIIGPVGIVIADSLMGEVTEKMAVAIGKSEATRILIPMNKCENLVAGVPNLNVSVLVEDVISKLRTVKS